MLQVESGNIQLKIVEIVVGLLVNYVVELNWIVVGFKYIVLNIELFDEIFVVLVDQEKILWVLINLVFNVVCYLYDYFVVLIFVWVDVGWVEVFVFDYGQGIVFEYQDKIFCWYFWVFGL